jgi:hypothetical protein
MDYLAVILFRVLKEIYSLKKYFYNLVFRFFIESFKVVEYIPSLIYTPHANRFRSRRLYPTIYQPNPTLCFSNRKAGTERPLLKEIIATTHKNTVVVAPTGIAALNAGGVTIHSMFQLPFGGFIPAFGVDSNSLIP